MNYKDLTTIQKDEITSLLTKEAKVTKSKFGVWPWRNKLTFCKHMDAVEVVKNGTF
jgi:hypothetical protein